MQIYQQILAATVDSPPQSVNETAKRMLKELTAQIKLNKSSRKKGDLVYEIVKTPLAFPEYKNVEKTMTKWEKFAQRKGIKPKRKSKMIWDDELKKYLPAWGSNSKQNIILRGGIVEVKGKTLSKLKKEKKLRVEKNKKARENNLKRIKDQK